MAKSNFFRAFVAGTTISDGRKITPEMIDQIVATFNVDTYAPRINVEHISGYSPEPPFNGYGTVTAVKAQDDEITIDGKVEKRRALYAQVDGNDQLQTLAKRDQKPFPSLEITDSYAGTGKVGLVGLAFTDKPASIATQKLQFSRSAPGTVFASGEDAPALEFEDAPADPAKVDGAIAGFFTALAARLKGGSAEPEPKPEPKPQPANDNDLAAFATQIGDTVAKSIATALKPVTDAHAKLQADFTALKQAVETTDPAPKRTPATGGQNFALTDC